jgi:hypothetical protein
MLFDFKIQTFQDNLEYDEAFLQRPKKCIGKKVKFTPTKVVQKCTFP